MDLVIKNVTEEQLNTIAAFAHAVKTGSVTDIEQLNLSGPLGYASKNGNEFLCNWAYRIKPKPNYLELHEKSGLKVGDKVKIITNDIKEGQGYKFSRVHQAGEAQNRKGLIGEITWNDGANGFWVDGEYLLPFYALEKVLEEWIVKYTGSGAENPVWKLDPKIYDSELAARAPYNNLIGVWFKTIKIS